MLPPPDAFVFFGATGELAYRKIFPALQAMVMRGDFDMPVIGVGRSGWTVEQLREPFGRDLASAQALNRTLHDVFPESAIFRIDHYLGNESVQNLIYFRFADTFLEPVRNRNYVDNVQITLAENFDVQGRGSFNDNVGAIRDVVQKQLLQVVALLAMDAPIGDDTHSIRAEKLRLFRAMQPLQPEHVVRGEFRGYRDEPGVTRDSQTETFAALRQAIDTWRWAGVPFYIRPGKSLPVTTTQVIVQLKRLPMAIFDEPQSTSSNYFRFGLSPAVVISAGTRVKRPGDAMRGDGVELVARHQPTRQKAPYERLPGDALRGETGLFTDDASVEAAWRVVDPVLGNAGPVEVYEPGSWGPASAAAVVTGEHGWHDPIPEASAPC